MQRTNIDDRSAAMEALARLLVPYLYTRLLRFCWLVNEEERASVASDIVVKVSQSVDSFGKNAIELTEALAWGWVNTIAKHTAIDAYRAMRRRPVMAPISFELPCPSNQGEAPSAEVGKCDLLLRSLSLEDQQLLLFFIQYYDPKLGKLDPVNQDEALELAVELGLSAAAAYKRFQRILAQLRATYRPTESQADSTPISESDRSHD